MASQLAFTMPTPKKRRQKPKAGWPRGKRRTTGRRNTPHTPRAHLTKHIPVHVTLRLDHHATGNARRRDMYKAIRTATTRTKDCIRIIHLSIQRTHLHLIVEANDRDALSSGMQSFEISAARRINRVCKRSGRVFTDRYNAEYLTTPTQTRNALSYVLNNWRKHGDDAISPTFRIDPYSSAILFDGFADYAAPPRATWAIPYEPLQIRPPESWLLRVGWRRTGIISCHEIPGSHRA